MPVADPVPQESVSNLGAVDDDGCLRVQVEGESVGEIDGGWEVSTEERLLGLDGPGRKSERERRHSSPYPLPHKQELLSFDARKKVRSHEVV